MAYALTDTDPSTSTVTLIENKINVTVNEDYIKLSFSPFQIEFYKDTFGYNKIYDETGNVLVYDERVFLEYWKEEDSEWKPRGTPQSLSYIQISDTECNVTRVYTDFLGTDWSVIYNIKSDRPEQPVKSTIVIDNGQTDEYRVRWSPSGITYTENVSISNRLIFSDQNYDKNIQFDWADVYDSLGDITSYEVNTHAQGKKADIYFNVGEILNGQTLTLDPSIVGVTTGAYPIRYSGQRKTFFDEGRHWVLYYDNSNFRMKNSTDWGQTWSDYVTIRSGGSATEMSLYYNETTNKMSYAYIPVGVVDDPVYYRRATLYANGSLIWDAVESSFNATTDYYHIYPSIVEDTNGYPWIGYGYYISSAVVRCTVANSSTNNGVFTLDKIKTMNETLTASFITTQLERLPGGDIYAVYGEPNDRPVGRLWDDSESVWSSQEQITTEDFLAEDASQCSLTKDENNNLHFSFSNSTDSFIKHAIRWYDSGVWSSLREVNDHNLTLGVALTASGGDVFAFWSKYPNTTDVYYKKWTNSSGWNATPTLIDRQEGMSPFITAFRKANENVVGLAYVSDFSPYNLHYAYLNVSVPELTVTLTIESTDTTTTTSTSSDETDSSTRTNITTSTDTYVNTTTSTDSGTNLDLWVDSFSGDLVAWDTEDAPLPYLNNSDDNWIHEAKSSGVDEGYFGFEDTALLGIINSVTLYIECYGDDTNDQITIYIDSDDGSGYDLEGTITVDQTSYAYETLVCSSLDTWSEILFASMQLQYIAVSGGDDVYVRRAYLRVNYDPVTTVTSTTETCETIFSTTSTTQYSLSCETIQIETEWTIIVVHVDPTTSVTYTGDTVTTTVGDATITVTETTTDACETSTLTTTDDTETSTLTTTDDTETKTLTITDVTETSTLTTTDDTETSTLTTTDDTETSTLTTTDDTETSTLTTTDACETSTLTTTDDTETETLTITDDTETKTLTVTESTETETTTTTDETVQETTTTTDDTVVETTTTTEDTIVETTTTTDETVVETTTTTDETETQTLTITDDTETQTLTVTDACETSTLTTTDDTETSTLTVTESTETETLTVTESTETKTLTTTATGTLTSYVPPVEQIYLYFDYEAARAQNDTLTMPSHASMNLTGDDSSWEFWMQINNNDIVDSLQYVFIDKEQDGTGFLGFFEDAGVDTSLYFTLKVNGGTTTVDLELESGEITGYLDNEWHVWVFLYNATAKTISLNIDGMVVGTSAVGEVIATYDTPAILEVGNSQDAYPFIGNMSDFKWYGRLINTTEIAYSILNAGVPKDQTDLIVWLKMDEGTGDTAADSSSNSNDATLDPDYPTNAPEWFGAIIVTETATTTETCETSTLTTTDDTETSTLTVTDDTETKTLTVTDDTETETLTVTESTETETLTVTESTETETLTITDACETSTLTVTDACETETLTVTDETVTETTTTTDETVVETTTTTDETVIETLTTTDKCETSTLTTTDDTETSTLTTTDDTETSTLTVTESTETETLTVTDDTETETLTVTDETETETITTTDQCETETLTVTDACETETLTVTDETQTSTLTVTESTETSTLTVTESTETVETTETETETLECETIETTDTETETESLTLNTTHTFTSTLSNTTLTTTTTDSNGTCTTILITALVTSTNTTAVTTTSINGTSTSTSINQTATQTVTTSTASDLVGGGNIFGVAFLLVLFIIPITLVLIRRRRR